MSKSKFKHYFYIRANKAKTDKSGGENAPVYVRLVLNKERKEFSAGVLGPLKCWSVSLKLFDSKSPSVKRANNQLKELESRIDAVHWELKSTIGDFNLDDVLNKLNGVSNKHYLIQTFQERLIQLKKLVGIDYTQSTIVTYEVALKHLVKFLEEKDLADVELDNVNSGLLKGFNEFLKMRMSNNSANKYMRKLKAVLNNAADNDKFDNAKLKKVTLKDEEVVREFLTEEEIKMVTAKDFAIARIATVRDMFLFQCYTGLAYADINSLTAEYIHRSSDRVFVIKPREKTRINARIPLVPEAVELLDKYSNHLPNGKCFPIPSNQKFNAYLQEVADLCGITKPLTSHIARHTFATRMLNNGMPKDVLQDIMGLTTAKHLGIYAKMQKETLHEAMMKANSKRNEKPIAS